MIIVFNVLQSSLLLELCVVVISLQKQAQEDLWLMKYQRHNWVWTLCCCITVFMTRSRLSSSTGTFYMSVYDIPSDISRHQGLFYLIPLFADQAAGE